MALPAFRDSLTVVQTGSTTWTFDKPDLVEEDDVMLVTFAYEGPASSVTGGTIPSGWALVTTPPEIGWPHTSLIYVKVAGASEPADYTWTLTTSEQGVKGFYVYSGVDTTDPIEDAVAVVAPSDPTPPHQYATDTVTTGGRDRLLCAHFAIVTNPPMTWTASGMTERGDLLAGAEVTSSAWFDVAAGPAGTYSKTGSAANDGAAQGVEATRIALRPAPFVDTAPSNTVAPVASGNPTVGETLACTTGSWTADPTPSFTYQWQRDTGGGFANIVGATSSSRLLDVADEGADIRCVVTADNDVDPNGTASSNTLGPVEPEPAAPDCFLMTEGGLVATAGRLMTAGGLFPPP